MTETNSEVSWWQRSWEESGELFRQCYRVLNVAIVISIILYAATGVKFIKGADQDTVSIGDAAHKLPVPVLPVLAPKKEEGKRELGSGETGEGSGETGEGSGEWELEFFESEAHVTDFRVDMTEPVVRLARPGEVGIYNEGQTCYFSSTLQHFLHIREIREALAIYNPGPGDKVSHDLAVKKAAFIKHVFDEFNSALRTAGTKWATAHIMPVLTAFEVNINEPADVGECMLSFGDPLDHITNGAYSRLFGVGLEETNMEKPAGRDYAETTRVGFQGVVNLPLPRNPRSSLETILGDYTSIESVDRGAAYEFCRRRIMISSLPTYLTFRLGRSRYDMGLGRDIKADLAITYPLELDMKMYSTMNLRRGNTKYQLYGILIHGGRRGVLEGGHYYYAYRQNTVPMTPWVVFDDTELYYLSDKEVLRKFIGKIPSEGLAGRGERIDTASILIYKKVNQGHRDRSRLPVPRETIEAQDDLPVIVEQLPKGSSIGSSKKKKPIRSRSSERY